MKKIICILFALSMLFTVLSACTDKSKKNESQSSEAALQSGLQNSSSAEDSTNTSTKLGTGCDTAEDAAKLFLLSEPFSYKSLVQELINDGFTQEQAAAAADKCGADWNEQAARAAKEYTKKKEFTKDGLVEQLKYDGFTDEQAEYGAGKALENETQTDESSGSDKEDLIKTFE